KSVIMFTEENSVKEVTCLSQERLIKGEEKGPLGDKPYIDAVEKYRRLSRGDGIDAVMDKNQLDVIVAPTGGVTGKTDVIYVEHGVGGSSSIPAMAGYPNITVPCGQLHGLPLGMSF